MLRDIEAELERYKDATKWKCPACNKRCDPKKPEEWAWDGVVWSHKHPMPIDWMPGKRYAD